MEQRRSELQLCMTIDSRLYADIVVHKCFYWYTNDYHISIQLDDNNTYYNVILRPINPSEYPDWDHVLANIQRDLIDFKLRQAILDETKIIRELIVAKAFAHYDDTDPDTVISDPVGFDPKNI